MDIFKNIFSNPLRDKYKNTFDEDEYLGDYAINFRTPPIQSKLEEIGNEFIEKCADDCKHLFNFKEVTRTLDLSEGYISKRKFFFFTIKIPLSITFVDVREKGFIVEDYCVKISLGSSMLTGGYKFNSYITNKKDLVEFINNKINE